MNQRGLEIGDQQHFSEIGSTEQLIAELNGQNVSIGTAIVECNASQKCNQIGIRADIDAFFHEKFEVSDSFVEDLPSELRVDERTQSVLLVSLSEGSVKHELHELESERSWKICSEL